MIFESGASNQYGEGKFKIDHTLRYTSTEKLTKVITFFANFPSIQKTTGKY